MNKFKEVKRIRFQLSKAPRYQTCSAGINVLKKPFGTAHF